MADFLLNSRGNSATLLALTAIEAFHAHARRLAKKALVRAPPKLGAFMTSLCWPREPRRPDNRSMAASDAVSKPRRAPGKLGAVGTHVLDRERYDEQNKVDVAHRALG